MLCKIKTWSQITLIPKYRSDKWFKNKFISAYDEVFKWNKGERNSIEAGDWSFPTIDGREEKLTLLRSKVNACWEAVARREENCCCVSNTEGSTLCQSLMWWNKWSEGKNSGNNPRDFHCCHKLIVSNQRYLICQNKYVIFMNKNTEKQNQSESEHKNYM